jgi:hypothetical protein
MIGGGVGFDFLFGIDTPAEWIQEVGVGEPPGS